MKDLNLNLKSDAVKQLIDNGVIRENYIQLVKGFNSSFTVVDRKDREVTSFKDGSKFEMPVLVFSNDDRRFSVWGTTLFNAYVIDSVEIKTKPIERAKGLPVYFKDEFFDEHPNLKRVSDFMDEDGGFTFQTHYTIEGAIVTKSRVDEERWLLGHKLYVKGLLFLEWEQQHTGNSNLRWISEERVIEIAQMSKKDRTFDSSVGNVTLPSHTELKIIGKADEDVRFASATFIIKKW